MTIEIKTDAHGKAIIWSEVGGRKVPLPAENIYIRAGDGHVFTAVPAMSGLERLRPHEVAMLEFWLAERGAGDTGLGQPDAVVFLSRVRQTAARQRLRM